MTVDEKFEKCEDEYLKFKRVENKLSSRADLHAFLMLDKLENSNSNIVMGSLHEEIHLSISEETIEKLTLDETRDLVRCGVSYDREFGSLVMFA